MSKPTIVTLRYGPSADGYTFIATNYRNIEFSCFYDGRDIKLEIHILGTRVSEALHLVHGLFHESSNFKKKLFREYFYLKPKEIRKISFRSTTGYTFVVTKESNPVELVREYYSSYHYDVHENDSEEDILERSKMRLDKILNQKN